jgi:hypothetical protein
MSLAVYVAIEKKMVAEGREGADRYCEGAERIAQSANMLIAWRLCMELDEYVSEIPANGPVTRDFDLRIALSSLRETQTHLDRGLRKKSFDQNTCTAASRFSGRASKITTRLLASKLRQIAEEERKKKERARRS